MNFAAKILMCNILEVFSNMYVPYYFSKFQKVLKSAMQLCLKLWNLLHRPLSLQPPTYKNHRHTKNGIHFEMSK